MSLPVINDLINVDGGFYYKLFLGHYDLFAKCSIHVFYIKYMKMAVFFKILCQKRDYNDGIAP